MPRKVTACAALLVFLLPALGYSQGVLSDWSIFGTNTARVEYYGNSGNPASPIYPFEDFQGYNELSVEFSKRQSLYESMRLYTLAVLNESDYRTNESGLLFENLNFTWEKGDTLLPFRSEVGNYYGFFSYRTLQQSLKGAQVELQPLTALSQSIVLTAGGVKPNYQDLDLSDDLFVGMNWLLEPTEATTFGFNTVYNHRNATGVAPTLTQWVFSLLGEQQLRLASQNLTVEGELAYFTGDTQTGGTGFALDRSDGGYYAQVSGNDGGPLDYRFRFESYGQDYRPNGAVVAADRRSFELHGGWRFLNGVNVAGRLQTFRNALESSNPVDTDTAGIRITGPLVPGTALGGSTAVDAFVQNRESRDGTTDSLTQSLSVNMGAGLGGGWTGRLGVFLQGINDRTSGPNQGTYQVIVGGDHALSIGPFRGTVNPSLLFRARRATNADVNEYGPQAALNLAHDRHSVGLNYSLLQQIAESTGAVDNTVHRMSFNYTYVVDDHRLSFETDFQSRDPQGASSSDGIRVAFSYTYTFEKPRGEAILPPAQPVISSAIVAADILGLKPGVGLETARTALADAGITNGVEQSNVIVYEARMLTTITQRQRLALVHEENRITMSVLIIDFDDVGNLESMEQTFERVREALLQRYGSPTFTVEEGSFRENVVDDINAGRLIRIVEWHTPTGRLRFGIPRRLDRGVRMEVQHAHQFPPFRQTLWSLEQVR